MRNLLLMMLVVAVLVGFAMMSEPATAAPKPSADLGVCPDSIGTNVILAEKADVGPPILAALLDARANSSVTAETMDLSRARPKEVCADASAIHVNVYPPYELTEAANSNRSGTVLLRDHAPC